MQSSFNLAETWIELVNVCEKVMPLGKQKKKVYTARTDTLVPILTLLT
jgi:hypothetical protein